MISEETIFILGAGSSCLYGFPTGRQLRSNIINNFSREINRFRGLLPSGKVGAAKQFINNFDHSNIQSIDKFLTQRPEYSEIGTWSIAIEILKAEFDSKTSEQLLDKDKHSDWYFYLHNKMLEKSSAPDDYILYAKNKISFITFNYDRSLDYYLYNSFSHSYPDEIFKKHSINELFPFQFIHVYGALPLHWQTTSGKEINYREKYDQTEDTFFRVMEAAKSIRIMYDDRKDDEMTLAVQTAIMKAKRVFFLGFGYADENLEKLGIPESIKGKQVYGTAMGFTSKNMLDTIKKLNPEGGGPVPQKIDGAKGYEKGNCYLYDIDCVGLLNQFL